MTIPTVAEIITNSDALKAGWAARVRRRTWLDTERERQQYRKMYLVAYNKLYADTVRSPNKMLWFEQRADGSV